MADEHPYRRKPRRKYPKVKSRRKATAAALVLGRKDGSEEEMSAAGRALHDRRYSMMTRKERTAQASKAAQAYWASMSEEEKKLEMKRRHRVARRRRMDARLQRIRNPK